MFGKEGKTLSILLKDLSKSRELAYCMPTDTGWLLVLDKNLHPDVLIHFFVHEYAHTMTPDWERPHHGPAFGVAYAAVYTFVFEDSEPNRRNVKVGVVDLQLE